MCIFVLACVFACVCEDVVSVAVCMCACVRVRVRHCLTTTCNHEPEPEPEPRIASNHHRKRITPIQANALVWVTGVSNIYICGLWAVVFEGKSSLA